ncbi:MAG: hypothetical protein ABGX16_07780 [Pirellulales bacterium]
MTQRNSPYNTPHIIRDHLESDRPIGTASSSLDPDRLEHAEPFGRRYQLLLAKGHYAAAGRLISEARLEMERDENDTPFMDIPMGDVGISNRIVNMLEQEFEAIYVRDLKRISTAQLLEAKNSSVKTIDGIWQKLLLYVAKRIGGEAKE